MGEGLGKVGGWVRDLVGFRGDGRPPCPADGGTRCITSGLSALIEGESTIGSAVFCAVEGVPRAPSVTPSADAGSAIAAGYGAALCGRRATIVVPGDEIGPIIDRLRRAVERHAPMVLYVVSDEPSAIEAFRSAGAPVAVATDPSDALDLGLVARRLSEQALVPVVVVIGSDEVANAVRDLRLPTQELIDRYLGMDGDRVPSPTPAQVTLFGDERRRVPSWFDGGRPTAHGQRFGSEEIAAARVGRDLFFGAHVGTLLDEAIEAFAKLTGRRPAAITTHGASRPRHWLVARGAAATLAAEIVREDRALRRARFGVIAVRWFLPSRSEDRIARETTGAQTVTVLGAGEGPDEAWASRIAALARAQGLRCFTAATRRPDFAAITAACGNALAGEDAAAHLELDIRPPSLPTEFPRRQAMLDRLRRHYPQLEQIAVKVPETTPARQPQARTYLLYVESLYRPERDLERIATRLSPDETKPVRGRIRPIERGLWEIRLTFASGDATPFERDAAVDVLLIGHVDQTLSENPLLRMAVRGVVGIASSLDPETLGASLPEGWRAVARALELSLFRIESAAGAPCDVESLLAAAESIVSGTGESGRVPLESTERDGASERTPVPLAIRRFGHAGERFDNVARFWSELIEPRMSEPRAASVPDPYLAAGAVPACSSSFGDASFGRETLPSIDPARCTGCGRCWESCPDSAIGPVAQSTRELIDAVADRIVHADDDVRIADRVRRAHKQLAARLETQWTASGSRAVPPEGWREAFDWLFEKMGLAGEELGGAGRVRDRLVEQLEALPLSICEAFFEGPRREGGAGSVLLLAINPRACQGCGICETVCPEAAVIRRPQTGDAFRSADRLWRLWEGLSDTTGPTIARLSATGALSPLAAILLSRDCALAVTGRGSEPGSGERLAVRQLAAVVEYQLQRRTLAHVRKLEESGRALRAAIRDSFGEAVEAGGLARLADILDTVTEDRVPAAELMTRLEDEADVRRVRAWAEVGRQIDEARRALVEGEHGLGRARYGVVLHGEVAREWAGTFPLNPFSVPTAVDLMRDGADVAIGLASARLEETVNEARLLRKAELLLEQPADIRERERRLDRLERSDLTPDELATSPPILVLSEVRSVSRDGDARLTDLLTSGLPIKLVLLDEQDLSATDDPLLALLARRGAFVLSTSISTPAHLFDGVSAAIDYPGPAVIRIHTPSPRRHGFPTSRTIERASDAVASRVHPLLRYDPRRAGVFGTRIDLEGNPAPDRVWVEDEDGRPRTPRRWAEGERRFTDSNFPPGTRDPAKSTVPGPNGGDLALGGSFELVDAAKCEQWRVLQELAGVVTPFTETLEKRIRDALRADHESEVGAAEIESRTRLDELKRQQLQSQAERLRRRLMELAGHGNG